MYLFIYFQINVAVAHLFCEYVPEFPLCINLWPLD